MPRRKKPTEPELHLLPDDLAEAFEQFKLAINRRNASRWADVTREQCTAALRYLEQLAQKEQ